MKLIRLKHSKKHLAVKFFSLLFCAIFLFTPLITSADAKDKSDSLKAVFLYNLLNYIIWPEDKASGKQNLCILGESPFGSTLEYIKIKAKNRDHEIDVAFIPALKTLLKKQTNKCHMIYITSEAEGIFNKNAQYFEQENILTVSDIKNFSHKGGIELKRTRNKITLIINQGILKNSNLKASSKLLKIAEVIGK